MAESQPDGGSASAESTGTSGRAAFVEALRVRRNAKWGAAVGFSFTAAVFVLFVLVPGAARSPLWYVGLGFVLALSMTGLVAFLLTLVRAVRLSREL